jgi:hypothetical protein
MIYFHIEMTYGHCLLSQALSLRFAHSGKKYRVCQHLIGVRSRVVGFFSASCSTAPISACHRRPESKTHIRLVQGRRDAFFGHPRHALTATSLD